MILSKYCFVDLVDLGIAGRNSDPGHMATQVVSGISFLGAGVIFRDRNSSSIKGLTTAAGMWATSAIVSPWATTPLWRRSSASASRIHPKCRNTSVSSSKATAATSNAVMAYWTFLIAGIASLFLADGPALLSALAEPRTGLAALGLMVMGTALPFTLYTKGLETVESGKAAIIANIEPVMSAVIGVTVFQETLGLWTLVGIVLVLSGVVVLACEKEPDK